MSVRFALHHFASAPAGAVDDHLTSAVAGLCVGQDWEDLT